MKKSTPRTPRTSNQNRRMHALFGRLGMDSEAISETVRIYTYGRTEHTSEMESIEAMMMIRFLESETRSRRTVKNDHDEKMDRLRKRVMASIGGWLELRCRTASIQNKDAYIKEIACRAAGVEDFNRITAAGLTRTYNEYCLKQRVLQSMKPDDFFEPLN